MPTSRVPRLLAGLVLVAAAVGCNSAPRSDDGAALDERRAEAVRLASRGREAQAAGDRKQAIEYYYRSIEAFPELPGVRTNLGVALLDEGDILDASDRLKEEVQLNPANAQGALVNLGIIYRNAGQPMPARDYFLRALELTPNDPLALRGAIETSSLTNYDEEKCLELVRRGMMVERDPKVIDDYKWRQFRLEAAIKNRPKYRQGEDHLKSGSKDASPVVSPADMPREPAAPVEPRDQTPAEPETMKPAPSQPAPAQPASPK
jgi:tetratricopeptide (TPR) repeat protein